jgi:hypothetical protein
LHYWQLKTVNVLQLGSFNLHIFSTLLKTKLALQVEQESSLFLETQFISTHFPLSKVNPENAQELHLPFWGL